MAWLDSEASKRVDQAVYNFRYQYDTIDADFEDRFGLGNMDKCAPGLARGDEVVRRNRQNIIDRAWPGLSEAYAQAKLQTLRIDNQYKNPTARWNGAGGYDVTATQVLVDPAGWSVWIKVSDLEDSWS